MVRKLSQEKEVIWPTVKPGPGSYPGVQDCYNAFFATDSFTSPSLVRPSRTRNTYPIILVGGYYLLVSLHLIQCCSVRPAINRPQALTASYWISENSGYLSHGYSKLIATTSDRNMVGSSFAALKICSFSSSRICFS